MAAMQLAIHFECELSDAVGLHHDALAVRVDGPFDRTGLERSLAVVTARHDVLRTSFDLGRFREPLQLVHRGAGVLLTVDDGAGTPLPDDLPGATALADWWRREVSHPFDSSEPPLLRCHVLRRGTDSFHLCLAVHHSILDGWSLARLMTELLLAYDRQLAGDDVEPGRPTTCYRDFVAAEQAAAEDPEAERYWQDALAEYHAAPMPVYPGTAEPYRFELPRPLDEALRQGAAAAQVPVKSVFLAAHLWAVAQLVGPDVVTGVQVNGRLEHPEGDLVLGLFLNIVPLGCRVDGGTWDELIRAAFAAERRSQPYRRYPLARIRQLTDSAPFEVAFNYTDFHTFTDLDALARVRTRDWWSADRHSFPLLAEVVTDPGTGRRWVVVSAGADSPLASTGAEVGDLLRRALEGIAADPKAAYPVTARLASRQP